MKEIRGIGETFKIICPVEGFPEPIFEWSKVKTNYILHAALVPHDKEPPHRGPGQVVKLSTRGLPVTGAGVCLDLNARHRTLNAEYLQIVNKF